MPEPLEVVLTQVDQMLVHHVASVDPDEVLLCLGNPGVVLKESSKSLTRRVGPWVVKEHAPRLPLKVAFLHHRYYAPWKAALYLHTAGVGVPGPIAFVEHRIHGIPCSTSMISEFLDGYITVEQHADALARANAPAKAVLQFLTGLAEAVNQMEHCGAYHRDLAGKNILTLRGGDLRFIDLDSVSLDRVYTERLRFKNHVQLYDSFCDWWGPDLLDPFIALMTPDQQDPEQWAEQVHQGQQKRRQLQQERNVPYKK